eukprot:TRINITY_DN24899_c0_g2_i1.p1 TRINITY_DN24899_c0_g2~~TRINITY_DN24899_c0_g2_i1.p1  ORF type:complete len:668 (+),score=63.81 TRINITY_DN24899_c0_g2_i1:87-2090(+)
MAVPNGGVAAHEIKVPLQLAPGTALWLCHHFQGRDCKLDGWLRSATAKVVVLKEQAASPAEVYVSLAQQNIHDWGLRDAPPDASLWAAGLTVDPRGLMRQFVAEHAELYIRPKEHQERGRRRGSGGRTSAVMSSVAGRTSSSPGSSRPNTPPPPGPCAAAPPEDPAGAGAALAEAEPGVAAAAAGSADVPHPADCVTPRGRECARPPLLSPDPAAREQRAPPTTAASAVGQSASQILQQTGSSIASATRVEIATSLSPAGGTAHAIRGSSPTPGRDGPELDAREWYRGEGDGAGEQEAGTPRSRVEHADQSSSAHSEDSQWMVTGEEEDLLLAFVHRECGSVEVLGPGEHTPTRIMFFRLLCEERQRLRRVIAELDLQLDPADVLDRGRRPMFGSLSGRMEDLWRRERFQAQQRHLLEYRGRTHSAAQLGPSQLPSDGPRVACFCFCDWWRERPRSVRWRLAAVSFAVPYAILGLLGLILAEVPLASMEPIVRDYRTGARRVAETAFALALICGVLCFAAVATGPVVLTARKACGVAVLIACTVAISISGMAVSTRGLHEDVAEGYWFDAEHRHKCSYQHLRRCAAFRTGYCTQSGRPSGCYCEEPSTPQGVGGCADAFLADAENVIVPLVIMTAVLFAVALFHGALYIRWQQPKITRTFARGRRRQ